MTKQDDKDMIIDSYIRKEVKALKPEYDTMEPSEDFAHKVMMKAIRCEKTRCKQVNLMLIAGVLSPFVLREIWMIVRADYFSVTSMPLSNFVYGVYHFILSPASFFILLFTGLALATGIYIKRWRGMEQGVELRQA